MFMPDNPRELAEDRLCILLVQQLDSSVALSGPSLVQCSLGGSLVVPSREQPDKHDVIWSSLQAFSELSPTLS